MPTIFGIPEPADDSREERLRWLKALASRNEFGDQCAAKIEGREVEPTIMGLPIEWDEDEA